MSDSTSTTPPDPTTPSRDDMLREALWRADMVDFARRRQAGLRRKRQARERTHCPECGHRRAAEFGGHAPDCAQMFFPARFVPKVKHQGEFLAGSFVMIDPGIDLQFTHVVRLLAFDGPLGPNDDPTVDRRRRIPVLLIPTHALAAGANRLALSVARVKGNSRRAVKELAGILHHAFVQMRVLQYYLLTLTVWEELEQRTATELRTLARTIVEAVASWLDMRVKPTRLWSASAQ
jgi:hypothetical protein